MIYINLEGRIGNNLWQVAAAATLAERLGEGFVAVPNPYYHCPEPDNCSFTDYIKPYKKTIFRNVRFEDAFPADCYRYEVETDLNSIQSLPVKKCAFGGVFPKHTLCIRACCTTFIYPILCGNDNKVKGEMPAWVQLLPPREDIATYYNAADVFLSASRTEAFSYCLVEAAYCRPMLVSSDIPGPNDLRISGMQLFPTKDADALSDVLYHELILPIAEQEYIRQARKDSVVQRYNLTDWCLMVIENYVKVLNR